RWDPQPELGHADRLVRKLVQRIGVDRYVHRPRGLRLAVTAAVEKAGSWVAECFWPDVHEDDVRVLERRIQACLIEEVLYQGSILIRDDEVVLFQFRGTAAAVRDVAERARVPFERLLETTVARG